MDTGPAHPPVPFDVIIGQAATVDYVRATSRRRPRLSVVAPCYNEEDNLAALEQRVGAACRAVVGDDYEIVLVNDGSRDRTWTGIQTLTQTCANVVGVNLARNCGHQIALSAGLSFCRGERIMIIDADLQDPPELLGGMMELMDQGYDVVYGQRDERHGDSAPRKAASAIFYRLLQAMSDVPIPVDTGDFRIVSRRVLDVLLQMPEQHRFIRGMISWVGFRQTAINYERDPRLRGSSSYTLAKLFLFALDAITGFSVRPLRMAMLVGAVLSLFGFLFLGFSLFKWMVGGIPVAGWLSATTAIIILGGMQLCFLGLVGEYVGRIFMQVKQRPLYVVSELAHSPERRG